MSWSMAPIAILLGATAIGQVPAPAFESASIKASDDSERRAGYFTAPGKLVLENQTLKDCARIAYGSEVARAAEAPRWIETERFDIEVQAGRAAAEPAMRAMLRALLDDRFKLSVHRESRTFRGYALTVAKGGVKIREDTPGPGHISTRRGSLAGERASMANLAQSLAVMMGAPVVDMTSVKGVFTFTLEWTPMSVQPGALTTDDEEPNVLPDMAPGPSLFTAVQQQLGLKLESRKVPLELVVIDRAERPAN